MTVAIVNAYTVAAGWGTSLSQTITAPVSGNSLLVMAAPGNTVTNFTSITTNLGATATVDFVGADGFIRYGRFSNVTTGPTVITVTSPVADQLVLWVFEVSGLANAAPNFAASLAAVAPAYGPTFNYTVVPPDAGEFVLGALISMSSGSALVSTSPVFTVPAQSNYGQSPFYGTNAAAGSQTLVVTLDQSENGSSLDYVAYAAAAGGGSPTVTTTSSSSATEGSAVVHTVTLSAATTAITNYAATLVGNTATATTDFTSSLASATYSAGVTFSGGNLVVPSGVSSFTVTIATVNDLLNESAETFTLTVGSVAGVGTITDNDALPSISVSSPTQASGLMSFIVTLSAASGRAVTVNYATADNTGIAGTDYTAQSGTLTFAAGETTKQIDVVVL